MRARPKQANYLQKFKDVEPIRSEYGKDGRRLDSSPATVSTVSRVRDSSPVQTNGNAQRQRAGVAGISSRSSKEQKAATSAGSASNLASNGAGGGGGGDIKQYINLDDVPDGMPVSPRWVSRKTISYYQGDDNPPDDNYWATGAASSSSSKQTSAPPPGHNQTTRVQYVARASSLPESGYVDDPPPKAIIPKQAFQPMRQHIRDDDDNDDFLQRQGRGQDDEASRDGRGSSGGDGSRDGRDERREGWRRDDGRNNDRKGGSRDGSRGDRRDEHSGGRRTQFEAASEYAESDRAAQSKPRRATPIAPYRDIREPQDAKKHGTKASAARRGYDGEDDEDEDWDDDSYGNRRDTPPSNQPSDRYDTYDDENGGYGGGGYPKKTAPAQSSYSSYREVPREAGKRAPAQCAPPPMRIEPRAPSLPCEMKSVPPLPADSYATPIDQLYFSKQPRNVEYRPYTLEQYKAIKPRDYVEIANIKPGTSFIPSSATLLPLAHPPCRRSTPRPTRLLTLSPSFSSSLADLNSEILVAKRANQERIKEFSKNLLEFNQKVLQQQRKLPHSAESNSIVLAQKKIMSKREKALEFSKNVPKPKSSAMLQPSEAPRRPKYRPSGSNGDYEADWAGKDFDHDYMTKESESHGMNEVEFRRLETLEQKHNDSQRQIAAIKKSLNL